MISAAPSQCSAIEGQPQAVVELRITPGTPLPRADQSTLIPAELDKSVHAAAFLLRAAPVTAS
ncbi:MAG: hypothetical protein WBL84_27210 [Xanthobacteraceae bacterium]